MDTLATEAVNLGLTIATQANGGALINGIDNSLLSMIATTLIGFILRAIEKNRLRKKGHLNDKPA